MTAVDRDWATILTVHYGGGLSKMDEDDVAGTSVAMKRAFEDYDGSIFTSRGRIYERYFEAGYRAALVESEARERELEADVAKWHQAWVHNANRMEAREAVLVGALKEAIAGLERVQNEDLHPGRNLVDLILRLGEAEPEQRPWCCPICGEDCSHLLEAEPDGSER